MAIATHIPNIPSGLPQNPGSGNTSVGESGMAFDTTINAIKVFDGTTLSTFGSGIALNEVVSATNVILPEESGKVFFLNSATEFVSTLPAPAAGLQYTFIVTAAPASASYTVVTEGGCQVLAGHVLAVDLAGSPDCGTDVETTATGTTITFVDSVSVVGDRAHVISDGTSWFASCFAGHPQGITITG